ncbi:MAG: SDR family oxidoreductase, partial [Desulfobulbaceae bacterium]|nr:SDR family oxidoreductase [Desulfobulbaceae bacterium]
WFAADLSQEEQVEEVFGEILVKFTHIDILINNAACLESRDFLNLSIKEYELSFERNVRIYYLISHRVAVHMAARRTGVIVNISSVGADRAHRGLAGYDAFKGAVNSLTRSMALDLAPYGIRVNAIAPGAIDSLPEGKDDSRGGNFSIIPLGRPGTVSEIGAVAAFLASNAAAYIVGQVLVVDGGLSAQLTPPGLFV